MSACQTIDCCEPELFGFDAGTTAGGGVLYSNTEQSYTATCPGGTSGAPVTVTIAAGLVTGTSQAEADAIALAQATVEAESRLECV